MRCSGGWLSAVSPVVQHLLDLSDDSRGTTGSESISARICRAEDGYARPGSCRVGVAEQRHRPPHLAERLQAALSSHVTVEPAKGVLAERGQFDMDGAFVTLRAYCRRNRIKLGVVSAQVVRRELSPDDVLRLLSQIRRTWAPIEATGESGGPPPTDGLRHGVTSTVRE